MQRGIDCSQVSANVQEPSPQPSPSGRGSRKWLFGWLRWAAAFLFCGRGHDHAKGVPGRCGRGACAGASRKLRARRCRRGGSGWRSSRPNGDTTRMPGTWANGSWSATRSTVDGTGRRSTWSPPTSIRSPTNDLSRKRAEEFGFPIFPTIAEALRCGGKELAVDAVLIIGEHGDTRRTSTARRSIRATSSSSR